MITRTIFLWIILPLFSLAFLARASAAEPDKTVVITAGDAMKFSVTRIDAQPGQTIHLLLKNEGTLPKQVMGHNWILLKAGSDVTAYATAAMSAKEQNYQPAALAGEVLAAIGLMGARETGEVSFVVPLAPGRYPFLCSFPAHCQVGMRGELVVK